MKIDILTLFPEMFEGPFSCSLIRKAVERGLLEIHVRSIRDFTRDRHRTADDRPYGGGAGMVLKAEPIYRALKKISTRRSYTVCLSPQGKPFSQRMAEKLAAKNHLILLCGHYEGVDERVLKFVDEEISIGDYVLTGGEIPAMVVVDAVARWVPGVVQKEDSIRHDSFHRDGMLDWPHYTRPAVWRGRPVPKVLLSGDHAKILQWRAETARRATQRKRPDIYVPEPV